MTMIFLALLSCAVEEQPSDLYYACVDYEVQQAYCEGKGTRQAILDAESLCEDRMYVVCEPGTPSNVHDD